MLIKIMGLLLFTVGLILIILSIMVIFNTLNMLGPIERWVVFASGILLCVIGYFMARTEEELVIESGANQVTDAEHAADLQEASRHMS